MPITIKGASMKYKNGDGNYVGVNAIAETTTAEQVAAIQQKGAETRASIPSDYTTLSDTVVDLKSALSNGVFSLSPVSGLDEEQYTVDKKTWEQGGINSSGDTTSNVWIRTQAPAFVGGYLIHNNGATNRITVLRIKDSTGGVSYTYGEDVTSEWIWIPYEAGYKTRIRQRKATNSTPIVPSENVVTIYRPNDVVHDIETIKALINKQGIADINDPIKVVNGYISLENDTPYWRTAETTATHAVIAINGGDAITVSTGENSTNCAFLTAYDNPSDGDSVDFSEEEGFDTAISLDDDKSYHLIAPSDALFLYIYRGTAATDRTPISCSVNGYDYNLTVTDNMIARMPVLGNLTSAISRETREVTMINETTGQPETTTITSRWADAIAVPGIYRIGSNDDFYDLPAESNGYPRTLFAIKIITNKWFLYMICKSGIWFRQSTTTGWGKWTAIVGADEIDSDETIPEYYASHLETKIATIESIQESLPADSDSFIFITDYHILRNAGHSMALIKNIINRTGIKKIVFGGDAYATNKSLTIGRSENTKNTALVYERFDELTNEFYGLIGNHEWNKYTPTEAEKGTDQDTEFVTATYEHSLSGTYAITAKRYEPKGQEMTAEGNFYIDNKAKKVRYLFVQQTGLARITPTTLAWVASQLNTVPVNYNVVVFTHFAFISGDLDVLTVNNRTRTCVKYLSEMLGAYSERGSGSIVFDSAIFGSSYTVPYDFTNANGTLVGIFSGHIHHDSSLEKGDSPDGVLTIATTGDLYKNGSGVVYTYTDPETGDTYARTPGTDREQAFDVVHINFDSKTVYMTRIGGGFDRSFSFA